MGNVALIVLDTLRADAFDRHFDWVEGRQFDRAYATANWTVPSHASLFTGKYARAVGVDTKHQTLDCDRPTLAETLSEHGYRTRAISANQNVSAAGSWDRGFDAFYSPSDLYFRGEDVLNWEEFLATTDATDARLYLQAVAACLTADASTLPSLRAGYTYYREGLRAASDVADFGASVALDLVREWEFGDREFLYVNLMETHTPYEPPAGYPGAGASVTVNIDHSLGLADAAEDVERVYDGTARYLSDVTEAIYEALAPDFEYVVFCSDHGEMLGERGIYNHTYGLYPPVVQVPLAVRGDGIERRSDAVTSLLDVYPTVLEAADVDPPGEYDGASLFEPRGNDRYYAAYTGLLNKAVEQLREGGLDEARIDEFEEHLVAAALPDGYVYETRDGVETEGDVRDRPAEVVAAAERTLRADDAVDGESEAAPEIPERQLKDLGYM
jgi:arylsulfatase